MWKPLSIARPWPNWKRILNRPRRRETGGGRVAEIGEGVGSKFSEELSGKKVIWQGVDGDGDLQGRRQV